MSVFRPAPLGWCSLIHRGRGRTVAASGSTALLILRPAICGNLQQIIELRVKYLASLNEKITIIHLIKEMVFSWLT